jgi:CHAT domain-containing protein/tetratricopeptide (TPR) repeat protein
MRVIEPRCAEWRHFGGCTALILLALLAIFVQPTRLAAQPEPSPELKGLLENTTSLYKSGAYAEAMGVAERALSLTVREFGPEHERVGIQTYSLGLIAEAAGKLVDAERYYAQSVRIRDKVYGVGSAGSAQAMEKLGSVHLRQGRTAEAEAVMQRVLEIRSALVGAEHSFTAGARADLGSVNIARGNFPAALAYYRDAVRLLTSQRSSQTLAKSVADDEVRRHRAAFAGLAHAGWEVDGRSGGNRKAMMRESFAASQQAWTTSAASAIARTSARLGAGDTDLGRRIRHLQDMSERILALHEEDMKALAARSEQQRADPVYSAAQEAFRAASIARGRDHAPVVNRQKELVEQLQALLKRCPPGQKIGGCDASDRQREAITKELGTLAGEAAKGSGNLTTLNQRLMAADQQVPGYAVFSAARTARLDESQRLERAISDERSAIVKLFPDYVALTEPIPLSIEETQALLQPDEALVTLLVGPIKSFVWAISRERSEWAAIEAGADTLVEHVAQLRRGLDPAVFEQPDATGQVTRGFDLSRAHALYQLVIGPVASMLEGKRHVIVVPTGPLSSLPFQVLVTQPPNLTGDEAYRMRTASWLIRHHALSVLPSVQSLAALRRLAPASAPVKPFIGIGDPILTGPPTDQTQARGGPVPTPSSASLYRNGHVNLRAVREMVPLPETADELRAVAKLLGAGSDAVLLRENASEMRLKQTRLEEYRIIHFATHGLVAGDLSALAEPALVLTPPQTASDLDDGLLTASEVASLRLAAEWVVLSACNTASGSDTGAEALSGLARAFFYAGARGLLVSHWPVDAQAAVALTTQTFSALAANPRLGRAEAFRRTMLDMIDAGRPPTYWAPFVIVGEGANPR